jgi:uncharacterized damage-inducible protein DinB
MAKSETQSYIDNADFEAQLTLKLLRALPEGQYDFRPEPQGRSIGELAWHLAELEAYMSHAAERGKADLDDRPPGVERPRTIAELAPAYERVHQEAMARVRRLQPEDWDREIPFFGARMLPIHRLLWSATMHHLIHHRGQLHLMCRMAGGTPPGLYGPSREESAAMRAGR